MTAPPTPTATTPIRVLLVEDNAGDARLIVEMLREVNADLFELERVDALEPALDRLGGAGTDVVLLDLGLPESDGLETFERARRKARDEAIVVISGLDDERLAVEAVRSGAQDYLVKGRIDGQVLARVLQYAVERKNAERRLREREEQLRQLTETIREVYYLVAADFSEVIRVSPAYERVWGRSPQSLYDEPDSFLRAVLAEDLPALRKNLQRVVETAELVEDEFRIRRPDGEIRWILARTGGVTDDQGRVVRIAGVALDVTDRRKAEEALGASDRRLRNLFETVNLIVLVLDAEGSVEYVNPFFLEATSHAQEDVIGSDWIGRFVPEDSRDHMSDVFDELLEGAEHAHYTNAILTKDGEERLISWHNTVLRDAQGRATGTMSVGEDVTEQSRLQAQLEHAQKMEAVGRLAGGIAHDFNNLLTAILGPVDILLLDEPTDSVRADLMDIRSAVKRAATLTRQLLAFSRRQVLEPKVLKLNDLIGDLDRMLRRIIGEDIELRTRPGDDLGAVKADPGQLEQVVVNLAVNSRDAMPRGGTLTIETANVELDDQYVEEHVNVTPGRYVMLAVSDSGVGMDAETRSRIFEPFFTTKPTGKGTGLGLATVYGIVEQSGGHIWVYSEPGKGTTFKVYLPRVDLPTTFEREEVALPESLGGTETVLVVEDDLMVQRVTTRILEARGYRVLTASTGEEALETAGGHAGEIPLVITDVVMPDVGGMELAKRLERVRPGIRTIFVSGYTDETIVHHGVLHADVHFIQKPFTPETLAREVRKVLDADRR